MPLVLPLASSNYGWAGRPTVLQPLSATFLVFPPPPAFPVPVIRLPCIADLSTERGGLLPLPGISWPPCCPYLPTRVFRRCNQSATIHAAFRPKGVGWGSAFLSRPHMGSLALRPSDSLTIPKMDTTQAIPRYESDPAVSTSRPYVRTLWMP